jgi:hypothetical protein
MSSCSREAHLSMPGVGTDRCGTDGHSFWSKQTWLMRDQVIPYCSASPLGSLAGCLPSIPGWGKEKSTSSRRRERQHWQIWLSWSRKQRTQHVATSKPNPRPLSPPNCPYPLVDMVTSGVCVGWGRAVQMKKASPASWALVTSDASCDK